ncbi:CocE/NonD family hydrolase [Granulicella cerasi]|uniref:CocE/NonD family hydrolase n=1 Tax=Granulicella cerasi TaxID=741063 RepID=A0ABW1ZAG1_9BACT|nr:CocE/NonD family hydrolase [Granulicella cerasi]
MLRVFAIIVFSAGASVSAQRNPQPAGVVMPEYVRTEVMIPARDGVELHTVILRPKGSETNGPKLPIMMQRTPYGVDGYEAITITGGKPELAASGYIWVFQDIRGRYKSGGTFVMMRPVVEHKTKQDIDETTDTYDTVEWLLKNLPNNNGRVGAWGISYPGFLAMMAGLHAHPAVKAVSPQAPMGDVWLGDDFFHNGAFRETYGFDYVQQLEAQKTDKRQDSSEDQYDFFLKHTNFADAAASAGMTNLPTAQLFLTNPNYTQLWRDKSELRQLRAPEVAVLQVGGFWDQEDMFGPQAEYTAQRAQEKAGDAKHKVFMVLGPWNHGGWARGPGSSLGNTFGRAQFVEATGQQYRTQFEAPFFEWYLKDRKGFDLEDTASFRTGENQWHRYAAWPPVQGFKPAKFYLEANHMLTGKAPAEVKENSVESRAGSYVSDPANPVPYRHRPVQSTYGDHSIWRQWLVEDQSFVEDRADVANFDTPVLDKDVTVTGDVLADLYAATTGSDGDWIVKLIDIYPDGTGFPTTAAEDAPKTQRYELMVASEILRGRYRKSFEKPEAVKPGEVAEYKWSLHGVDHTFLKGHRIRVEVQSTWFPLYDRNPQTWVPNIMTAPAEAYQKQTITIFGSARYPSHLDVNVPDTVTLP